MNEHSLLTEDEAAFETYLDTLAAALHHRSRKQPLRDYCTGLLLPEGRKSMEPMAARLAPARTRTMHKTLLNFVSEGAWSDAAVLAAMRAQVLPAMQARGPLRFWIIDESGMPKKGKHSVGVARQYCGEVGKVDNCQVLVSLSVANEAACLPLAARLYLPEAWAVDEERRSKVGVPLDVVFQSKPAIALEQIRAAHAAGVPPGVVLADEVYGSTASFRQGVSALGLDYAVAVRATTPVRPPLDKRRARLWRGQDAALSVRALAARVPRSAWRWVTWREGSGPELSGRVAAIRVRVGRDGAEGEQTLLLEWPGRGHRSGWLLAGHPGAPYAPPRRRRHGQRPLVGRTKLPRTQARSWPRRLRGAGLAGLPSPPHAEFRRLRLPGDAPLPAALARWRAGRGLKLSSGRGSPPPGHTTGTPRAYLDPDHAPTPDRQPCTAAPALPLLPDATLRTGSPDPASTPIGLMEQ